MSVSKTPSYHQPTIPKRDSASSLGDEEQQSDGGDSSSGKAVIQEQTSFQFEGVRFSPKVMEFSDAFEGKQFQQTLKLQNVGRNPALVKIGGPSSFMFHMDKHSKGVKLLASGRSLTRTVSYVYHNDDIVQKSQIRVQINGRSIDYPIIVKTATPDLEVQPPELDFKVINMGASAKTLKITLINNGGRGTKFAFDLGRNELDLVVNPARGTLRAKSQMTVYVEMVGLTEGEFYKELWIKTNEKPIRVPITAEVMRPRLEVYHPNATGDFTLINFPPTFIGTQRQDSIVLRNFSADVTPFVIFAEIGGELKIYKDAKKLEQAFRMFSLSAEEGRLEPFESRIVTVLFKPLKQSTKTVGWHYKKTDETKKSGLYEYLVFFRINRVHCVEKNELERLDTDQKFDMIPLGQRETEKRQSIMLSTASIMGIPGISSSVADDRLVVQGARIIETLAPFSMPYPLEDKDVVRLCLHGEACEPELLIQPNSFEFETIKVGQSYRKVLKLTNLSQIPMKFIFKKIVNMTIEPMDGWLKSKQAVDVLVVYSPKFMGKLVKGDMKFAIKVDIFGRSAAFYENDKSLVGLGSYDVMVTADVGMPLGIPKPSLNLGISPKGKHEVGLLSEFVTYGSKYEKPYAAVLKVMDKKTMPMWMKVEKDKINRLENAVIAFPNDRYSIMPWNDTKTYRSIFTGNERYTPPFDPDYALSPAEMSKKGVENRFWLDYLRTFNNFVNVCPRPKTVSETDLRLVDEFKKKMISGLEMVPHFTCNPVRENALPKFVLIPLSPLFLCNIKVEPKLIDFQMVAANSSVTEVLKLHNTNPFPVSIRFIPGKSGVTLPNGDTRIVPPNQRKLLDIVFKTKDFGRYNGFLDYVINGSHQFKITVSANVVPKTLSIAESELNLEFGLCPAQAAFQPTSRSISLNNNLRSAIKFYWEMHSDASFSIEPTSGEVPPMTSLMGQIYFNLNPQKSCFAEANLISESGNPIPVKLSYRKYKTNVYFLMNKIELRELPLNLLETVKPTVRNGNNYDVAFDVVQYSPMPGVKISPKDGIIRARSTFDLEIEFKIPVVIDFQFEVRLRIQNGALVTMKVYGSVISPIIRITPMEVNMRRISAQSFDMATICVENIGKTMAHIAVNLKDYPEFKISKKREIPPESLDENGVLLPPDKSFKFYIYFEPNDVARYQFYLPIVINGIFGPPMMQDVNTECYHYYIEQYEDAYDGYGELTRILDMKQRIPCAIINCTVIGHFLRFSSLKFVFQKMKYKSEFQHEEIDITNIHVQPMTMCIRTDDVNVRGSPFLLDVVGKKAEYHSKAIKITLKPGQSVTLRAQFKPIKDGIFTATLPLFVRGYNDGYAYNFITLRGELKKHSISSDVKEIHFPPVPLRVGSEAIIQIIAERYIAPDTITHYIYDSEVTGKDTTEYIKIVWLDEPKITATQDVQYFSIQIVFQSAFPVSLRTFIVFCDSKGEYFPILLTAASDNCLLTNYIFLSMRYTKYKLVREEHAVRSLDETDTSSYKGGLTKPKFSENLIHKIQESNKKHKPKVINRSLVNKTFVTPTYSSVRIDPGPKLVIQMTKSMQRLTQLNFAFFKRPYDMPKKESNIVVKSMSVFSHTEVLSDSTKSSIKTPRVVNGSSIDVTYPFFPIGEDTFYVKFMMETIRYVELWIYEVVFHCEEYMVIPDSFQMIGSEDELYRKINCKDPKPQLNPKNIIDLVTELAGPKVRQFFPERSLPPNGTVERTEHLYSLFCCLLRFLNIQGGLLPHIRPENLLCYADYVNYYSNRQTSVDIIKYDSGLTTSNSYRKQSFSVDSPGRESKEDMQTDSALSLDGQWSKTDENFEGEAEFRERKNVEIDESIVNSDKKRGTSAEYAYLVKDFTYQPDKMEKKEFELRATQAWLDVLLQIYRTLVLPKVVYKKQPTMVGLTEFDDKLSVETISSTSFSVSEIRKATQKEIYPSVENYESNIYSLQVSRERILLNWLSYHYEIQRRVLWPGACQFDIPTPRRIDSFKTDLSDSLVLMAVTAAHCPYLIPDYFVDVFPVPQNSEQIYHNAVKLTNAWREVNIGLSVEPKDIVQSNPVFMMIIVVHLYDVLPVLVPKSLIRFSAPLTESMMRRIELVNKEDEKIIYEAKFIGAGDSSFSLVSQPTIFLKPNKAEQFIICYRARRIHKVTVTLLLDGYSVSPHFAKSIVFQLEGEPSDFTEYSTIKLHGPLYKVICLDIGITAPYSEEANYEICYSTTSPNVNESDMKLLGMKPWRDVWNRKTSRRLFINQMNLITHSDASAILNVTIACLTNDTRSFWLLFRSEIGDFIIRIDVCATSKDNVCGPIHVSMPKSWSRKAQCICGDISKNLEGANGSPVCPLAFYLKVPSRNNALWKAMFIMFQKTLDSKEKAFWKKHFETNIGIRLIKWLLSQEESTEAVDEFLPALSTHVSYTLKLDSNSEKYVHITRTLDIPDVRSKEPVYLPIHISNMAPKDLKVTIKMMSDTKKEIRVITYIFQFEEDEEEEVEIERPNQKA